MEASRRTLMMGSVAVLELPRLGPSPWLRASALDGPAGGDDLRPAVVSTEARTIHVDPGGSDEGPGTSAAPLRSLQAAWNRLPDLILHQQTIVLAPGVHSESPWPPDDPRLFGRPSLLMAVGKWIRARTTRDNRQPRGQHMQGGVVIRGAGSDQTILENRQGYGSALIYLSGSGNQLAVEGLTLRAAHPLGQGQLLAHRYARIQGRDLVFDCGDGLASYGAVAESYGEVEVHNVHARRGGGRSVAFAVFHGSLQVASDDDIDPVEYPALAGGALDDGSFLRALLTLPGGMIGALGSGRLHSPLYAHGGVLRVRGLPTAFLEIDAPLTAEAGASVDVVFANFASDHVITLRQADLLLNACALGAEIRQQGGARVELRATKSWAGFPCTRWRRGDEVAEGAFRRARNAAGNWPNLYQALTSGRTGPKEPAVDAGETSDGAVRWAHVAPFTVDGPPWSAGTTYPAAAVVWHDGRLYRTPQGGVAGDRPPGHGEGAASDGGIVWEFFHDARSRHQHPIRMAGSPGYTVVGAEGSERGRTLVYGEGGGPAAHDVIVLAFRDGEQKALLRSWTRLQLQSAGAAAAGCALDSRALDEGEIVHVAAGPGQLGLVDGPGTRLVGGAISLGAAPGSHAGLVLMKTAGLLREIARSASHPEA